MHNSPVVCRVQRVAGECLLGFHSRFHTPSSQWRSWTVPCKTTGELKVQQELFGPQPSPSHKGSIPTIESRLDYVHSTELVVSNEWRYGSLEFCVSLNRWATSNAAPGFIHCRSKGPDVFSRRIAVSDPHTIHIQWLMSYVFS